MKKNLSLTAIILLAGCSVGGVDLTKEAAFCEINGETFRSGENIPLADGCNFCVCSATGELTGCTEMDCENEVGLANPAAVKCAEDGFEYEIREDAEGGQFGVCIDAEIRECDEWAYFRGECALGDSETPETAVPVDETPEPEVSEDESPVEPEIETENTEPEVSENPAVELEEIPEVDPADSDEI